MRSKITSSRPNAVTHFPTAFTEKRQEMATPRCMNACCIVLMLAGCLMHLHRAAAKSQLAGEAELLLQIKRAWGDPPVLAAWSAASSATGAHCHWPYVGCDSAGRVTKLAIANTDIFNTIPDAISSLSSLIHLDISNAGILGVFPTVLYRCRSLRYLNISCNMISGKLPDDIGRGLGANLSTLDLSLNMFSGNIPASLSMLTNLCYLTLDVNQFTGTIPMELGEMTSLRTLWLAYNPFEPSELPASFKNLTNLVSVRLENCSLVGKFPSYFVKMQELERLDLSFNSLNGSIPSGIWRLKKLQEFAVRTNNFTGNFRNLETQEAARHHGFAAMSLTAIDISENNFTGTIPEVFGRLENLTILSLFSNNFSGEIPTNIGRLRLLSQLSLNGNKLTGTLPPELGKHSPNLVYIQTSDNELTGRIPEGLCAGGQLMTFIASNNRLNGSIPVSLADCASLQELHLESNQLSGEIPANFGYGTPLLKILKLSNNKLSGRIG